MKKRLSLLLLTVTLASVLCGCGSSTSTGTNYSSSSASAEKNTSSTSYSSDLYSPYEFYDLLSGGDRDGDFSYTLNSKATQFLKSNPSLFPAASAAACTPFTDTSIGFKHIEKSPTSYGDKLMQIDCSVIQIQEVSAEDSGLDRPFTVIDVIDYDGNQFGVFYYGSLPDVLSTDDITVYGLPLDMSSFANRNNGTTFCVVLAGSYVEKIG